MMDELRRAANNYSRQQLSEFLRMFDASTLAVMAVDFEANIVEVLSDWRYAEMLNTGLKKTGKERFLLLLNAERERRGLVQ